MLMNGEFATQFTIPKWNLVTIKMLLRCNLGLKVRRTSLQLPIPRFTSIAGKSPWTCLRSQT